MSAAEPPAPAGAPYPVRLDVVPATADRNRLTTAFRLILAIPHLILVGGPLAATFSWTWSGGTDGGWRIGGGGGLIGIAAVAAAIISWFAIVFTGSHPRGLWDFTAFYLRWRVRAIAYSALFRDEYPPFGEGDYPAALGLEPPDGPRDRLSVGFRLVLAIPHLIVVWALGIAWGIVSIIAWFAILFTGRYPEGLYRFGVGVFLWATRVEAYVLLMRDEYPPFSLE